MWRLLADLATPRCSRDCSENELAWTSGYGKGAQGPVHGIIQSAGDFRTVSAKGSRVTES
jgi:hypothetical protein